MNSGWLFHKGDTAAVNNIWNEIDLPHSYNTQDVVDDCPGYYRGSTWYKKTFFTPASAINAPLYLYFEGVGQEATVYVNGKLAGSHVGGYTGFRIPISKLTNRNPGSVNELLVNVTNKYDENVPPLDGDFTFFGGIYRDVYLVTMNPVHFTLNKYGGKGVLISTPNVDSIQAQIVIKANIENASDGDQQVYLENRVVDANGTMVASSRSLIHLGPHQQKHLDQSLTTINTPHLWSPTDPYLYHVESKLVLKNEHILDELVEPLGLRWFRFSADDGFFLNGKNLKLWGTSRHQDAKGMGNALPDALHVKDIRALKALGANFLRIAHYPQDPEILEACDRLGILTSVEIPIVGKISETKQFTTNCLNMQREMILQNFNHPSVIIWGYMNEVMLNVPFKEKARRDLYFGHIVSLAKSIDSLSRNLDSQRYTMVSCHGDFGRYKSTGLADIPQVIGWNRYDGWYGADINNFAKEMDKDHAQLANKPVIITEFGADADARLRSFSPLRYDKTLEYQTYFHQVYHKAIAERPYISGGAIWILNDFISSKRADVTPHYNTKGLMTINRKPKDAYLFYQAQFLHRPVVNIGSRAQILRSGIADDSVNFYCTQPIQVFSNQPKVNLIVNGRSMGSKRVVDGIATFNVPFKNGANLLEAIDPGHASTVKDFYRVKFLLEPFYLKDNRLPFRELNVNLGDKRYFTDEKLGQIWLPEKPYTPGSWGYIGGKPFVLKNRSNPYGSDIDVLGSQYDPIFETQRVGLEGFRLDVPQGEYEVTLDFAELLTERKRKALINELTNGKLSDSEKANRDFDVWINNRKIISHLGNQNYLIPEKTYITKITVNVTDSKGIHIEFKANKGQAILNGLQVRKLF